MRRVDDVQGAIPHGARQARPLHGRIALGVFGLQQRAVLDGEQRVDQQRRHRRKTVIHTFGVPHVVDRAAIVVQQLQPRLVFFAIGRIHAAVHSRDHLVGWHGLLGDDVAARAQAVQKGRKIVITEPLVVGAGVRVAGRIVRPRFDRKGLRFRQLRKVAGLPGRGAKFTSDKQGSYRKQQRPDEGQLDDGAAYSFHSLALQSQADGRLASI